MFRQKTNSFLFLVCLVFATWNCNVKSDHAEADNKEIETGKKGKKRFEKDAARYESEDRVIWQKPDLVIQQLGNVDGKTVADLGAGTGYFSRRIAYKGAKVIAIDIDPNAIRWMKDQLSNYPLELRERIDTRLAEPNDPNLKPQEVDMVLLVNTYSYIQNRVDYFTNLKKAIRPNGTMLIIDFKKKETPFGPPVQDRVDITEVENELLKAGYTILSKDEQSLDYQYIVKAMLN